MPGGGRLRNTNDFHKVVHAQVATLEQMQDAKTCLVRKSAELCIGSVVVCARHSVLVVLPAPTLFNRKPPAGLESAVLGERKHFRSERAQRLMIIGTETVETGVVSEFTDQETNHIFGDAALEQTYAEAKPIEDQFTIWPIRGRAEVRPDRGVVRE